MRRPNNHKRPELNLVELCVILYLVVVPLEVLVMLLDQAELLLVTLMCLRPFAVHAMVLLMVHVILPLVPWNLATVATVPLVLVFSVTAALVLELLIPVVMLLNLMEVFAMLVSFVLLCLAVIQVAFLLMP